MKSLVVFMAIFFSERIDAQDSLLWSGIDTCEFYVSMQGQFSAQSRWDVNLINAPFDAFDNRPKTMDISQELLDALNKNYPAFFMQALADAGIQKIYTKESVLKKWRKKVHFLEEPGGDHYYSIRLEIAGFNGLGGDYGGTDVRLSLKSLHRNENLTYGFAMQPVDTSESVEKTLENLKLVFHKVLTDAAQDLQNAIVQEQSFPRRFLTLAFNNKGLSTQQVVFVHQSLLDCLVELGRGQKYIANSKEDNAYTIIYRLKRYDENETEEDFIKSFAETIRFSVGNHAKYECSLWKTPMQGYQAVVDVDVPKKRISIGWKKEE